jgi:hypothetical protein
MLTVSKNYETTKHAVPVQETSPIQCSEIYISAVFVKLSQNTSRMTYGWRTINSSACFNSRQLLECNSKHKI